MYSAFTTILPGISTLYTTHMPRRTYNQLTVMNIHWFCGSRTGTHMPIWIWSTTYLGWFYQIRRSWNQRLLKLWYDPYEFSHGHRLSTLVNSTRRDARREFSFHYQTTTMQMEGVASAGDSAGIEKHILCHFLCKGLRLPYKYTHRKYFIHTHESEQC